MLVGGEGGEFDEGELEGGYVEGGELAVHGIGSSPGWKKAGFADIDKPEAAIIWLAIKSWEGVNIAGLGKVG